MGLTAREWVWLPKDEQERRKKELSLNECFLLRTTYDYVHPTEEEKASLTPEQWEKILREPTEEEILRNKQTTLWAMKEFKLVPEEVTFDEWEKAGCPFNWEDRDL